MNRRHPNDPLGGDESPTVAARPPSPQPPSGDPIPPRSLPAQVAWDHGSAAWPRIEGYQITSLLGSGGMGTVWRAWQLSTRREVALKLLGVAIVGSERARRRFDREVELTSRLEHPHIARVYDSGIHQGVYYYAMELVDGLPLDTYVRLHRLPRRQTLSLARAVCLAVQHAHQRGVIHRDLKPSNVLVDKEGRPRILDFGLAKVFEVNSGGSAVSLEGELAGTPAFMSPEQAAGRIDQLDTRTDVYSLGVVLYMLLTGKPPHDTSGPCLEILRRIAEDEVTRPRAASPDIDPDLEALLLKALSKEVDARYSSAGALASDIANYLAGEPLDARAANTFYFLGKKIRKHRTAVAAVGAAVVVLAGLSVYGSVRIARERDRAVVAANGERQQALVADSLRRQEAALRQSAELRLAEGLISWGDGLGAEGRWDEALRQYWEAYDLFTRYGAPTFSCELALSDAYEHAPPALSEAFDGNNVFLCAAVAADSRTGYVGFGNGSIRAWDLPMGRWLAGSSPTTAPTHALSSVVAPDSRYVFCGTQTPDGRGGAGVPGVPHRKVLIAGKYEPGSEGGRQVRQIQLPLSLQFVNPLLAVSTDGGRVAYCGSPAAPPAAAATPASGELALSVAEVLICRELAEGRPERVLQGESEGICSIAFLHDGENLLTGHQDGMLRLWNLSTGRETESYPALRGGGTGGITRPSEPLCGIACSRDGATALLGGDGGSLVLWDLKRGVPVRRLAGHSARVAAVACSPDGRLALSGDGVGGLGLWDLNTGELLNSFAAHAGRINAIGFSEDGSFAVSAGADGFTRVWPVDGEEPFDGLPQAPITCLACSADGSMTVNGHADGTIQVRDSATGKTLRRLTAWRAPVLFAAMSPDGRTLAASNRNGHVDRWDLLTGRLLLHTPGDMRWPLSHNFSPDGHTVVTFSIDGAELWDMDGGAPRRVLDKEPPSVAGFSPDGRIAFTGNYRGGTVFYDAATGARLQSIPGRREQAWALAVSPDGHRALRGDADGNLRLLDINGGRELRTMVGHVGPVRYAAFSDDGANALTAGDDGTIRAWDLATGRQIRTVWRRPGGGLRVAFCPKPGLILLSSDGNAIRLRDLSRPAEYRRFATLVQQARRSPPNDPGRGAADAVLGQWYALGNQTRWATELLQDARGGAAGAERAEGAGGPADVGLVLARCHWRSGDLEHAAEEFKKVLDRERSPQRSCYLRLCLDAVSRGRQVDTGDTSAAAAARR